MTTDCVNNDQYTWNVYGEPSTLNGVGLTYDASGREVEIASGSTYTQVLYGPIGKLGLMNGQNTVSIRTPLPGGGTEEILPTAVHILHADWLGSAGLATLFTGRSVANYTQYAPYGESEYSSTDLDFTGQFQDTLSGLYDFQYREYSPAQSRWINPDPAGLGAVDPSNPQTWNRYAYVLNNPLAATDPLGLDCAYDLGDGSVGVEGGDCNNSNDELANIGYYVDCDGCLSQAASANIDAATGTLSFYDSNGNNVGSISGFADPTGLSQSINVYGGSAPQVYVPLGLLPSLLAANNYPTSNNPTITAVHPPPTKPSSWWSKYTTQLSCETSVAIADISDQQDLFEGSGVVLGAGLAANSLTLGLAGDALIGTGLIGDAFHARSVCVPLAWGN
jgi:RHS repeat-associated protein